MQFLMSLWCWKPNQAIKRSKITQVFGFGIEIRREGKRLITLKSEVWKLGKKGKITPRTRITSKICIAKKKLFKNLRVGTPGNKQEIISLWKRRFVQKTTPHENIESSWEEGDGMCDSGSLCREHCVRRPGTTQRWAKCTLSSFAMEVST